MKTRYKITIVIVAVVIGIYVMLPPTMTVILCDDKILNLDDCGEYLQEKYSKQTMFKHFADSYPDARGLGFKSGMFRVESIFASSTLDDKIFASLEMNLNNSTFHYACQNHNLGDDYVIVELENITIQDLNDNNCITLNQLDVDLQEPATCDNYIYTNKPPEIYNITPTSDGAIVRWYQTPQSINGEHCGVPENYKIFVGLASPIKPPFEFADEAIPGGFRGAYEITGLESNMTYYVDIKGDWGTKIISGNSDVPFTTLNLGDKTVINNPIEKAKYEMSKKFPEQQNQTVSKWDFRTEPSYVIIPQGAVIEGNENLIPKVITVVLGKNNTVTWINEDDTAHGILSDKGSKDAWGSPGSLKPGESFSITFNNTGIFEYHGQPGPWITGKVVVIDSNSFSEINRQSTFYKNNKNSEKFEEYRILMQEKQKEIASKILGVGISDAYVAEGWNYPFRDESEIKPMAGTESIPTCNIPERIPMHLKKIRQSEMFQMFAGKYSQHQLTVEISDERYGEGLVHYDLAATSDDESFTARTYFHLNSCTDEMKWSYFLSCKDVKSDEHISTRIKSEIMSSLESTEFCDIKLEPWHLAILDYQLKIANDLDKLHQKIASITGEDESYGLVLELRRLGLLNNIARHYESENTDALEIQEDLREYALRFGSLPDELLELIEQRNEH